jgi:chemotaxis family two-component system sensor kinase Cph1
MATSFQGFRSLIENSHDAISVIDTEGEILYGSAATTKLFGYRPEEIVGRNCLELIHPEDREHSSRALRDVVTKPTDPLQWDARVRHKNGNYSWVESTVSNLLVEPDVQAIVVNHRDINARRAAELEKEQHFEELAKSNVRLTEFVYSLAHDLREPLGAISLCTDMLSQKKPLDAEARELAKFILDGATRVSAMVVDMLSFATTGMREPSQCVDLNDALAQATQNLAQAIHASGARVTVDPLPVIQSNQIQLVRLFQNLMSNAMKYNGESPPEIRVTAQQCEQEWVIRIKDNGCGIAPENHARVFQPFVRLENNTVSGNGLGLAACKNIVEGLGGAIWVESELGAGSAFCFTIPAGAESQSSS